MFRSITPRVEHLNCHLRPALALHVSRWINSLVHLKKRKQQSTCKSSVNWNIRLKTKTQMQVHFFFINVQLTVIINSHFGLNNSLDCTIKTSVALLMNIMSHFAKCQWDQLAWGLKMVQKHAAFSQTSVWVDFCAEYCNSDIISGKTTSSTIRLKVRLAALILSLSKQLWYFSHFQRVAWQWHQDVGTGEIVGSLKVYRSVSVAC